MRRLRLGTSLGLALALGLTVAAYGGPTGLQDDGVIDSGTEIHGHNHSQHGGTEGHLPASSENVNLIGKMRINQDQEGRVADVGVLGNYAYLGAYFEPHCQKGGVYVFDISKPSAPKQINFIRTANDSYVGEGVHPLRIDTPQFTGDVLLMNNETCDKGSQVGAVGGMSIIDVTNPKTHKYLAEGFGDLEPVGQEGPGVAHSIHSVFGWDAGDKAYAVMVDNEEAKDVDIVDISDPRTPVLIAEYDLQTMFPGIVDPTLGKSEGFLHDMIVKKIGKKQVMLLSYWDAGYVTLDVTNPLNVKLIGDSDFAATDPQLLETAGLVEKPEGNAHQAEFSLDNKYIVAADEDFDSYSLEASIQPAGTPFQADQGSDTPTFAEGDLLQSPTVFVGRACPGDPAVPAGGAGDQVAVVERGVCLFTEKVASVEQAGGYEAILIVNRTGSDACEATLGMSVAGSTYTFGVTPRSLAYDLFNVGGYDQAACLADAPGATLLPIAIGTTGDTVRFESYFDGWGYVHLLENRAGKLTDLDTYALPQAHDTHFASGFGDLSVHEVAMSHEDPRLAYLSYYAGGFRVARIVNDELVETGHFIDQGGNNFWGVEVWKHAGKEYVLASDRDYGLYIFEYTGP